METVGTCPALFAWSADFRGNKQVLGDTQNAGSLRGCDSVLAAWRSVAIGAWNP